MGSGGVQEAIPDNVPLDRVVDFDVNNDPRFAGDFFGTLTALRDSNPAAIVWSPRNGGHWIVTRARYFRQIFEDTETFSSRILSIPADITAGTAFIPLQLDPPEHGSFRKVIARQFAANHIGSLQPQVRGLAARLVSELRPRGECDFVADFAEVFPVEIFLTFVGLPLTDRPMLRDLVVYLNKPTPDVDGGKLVAMVDDYLAPHVAQRRRNPGDDLFSRILASPIDDREWTHEEAMRMCRNLLFGGLDTVVSLLSFVALHLARNQDQQQALRTDKELIPLAAFEFTRRFGTVSVGRFVVRDIILDGVTLRKGDMILLPTPLHNLDEDWLADAGEVRLDRGATQHMSMGRGPHRCVGEGLARQELICFLEEWLDAIPPFRLGEGAIDMRGGSVGSISRLPLSW